jgi:hypothetical protein
MNKLVYIFVPNEFVIGQVVLKSFIKRLAVAMVNKTVINVHSTHICTSVTHAPAVLSIVIQNAIETRRFKRWLSGIISMHVDFGVQCRGV